MQTDINSLSQFNLFIEENKTAAVYLSTPDCNVCKVLKSKVIEMIEENFPLIKFGYVNIEAARDVAAQNQVFSVPTILFFFEGKEFLRKARYVDIEELRSALSRIYDLMDK